ncbi:MAG: ABC transporter substrate-binding protein [Mogibacterium sp.]|nr:ABC transporter substrate-binding protein [Mogibacterium sp.]MBR0379552.1 ABC transporter substrate-binding protein [Mogibacterium sp.]
MKNTWKKAVVVAVSCMMVFSFAACGKSGGSGGSGAGDNVVVLGNTGPLTGPAAIYGNAVKNGGQLAVDEINKANPDGIQLAWQAEDDEADGEKAVNAYNKLMDDGMDVFIGSTTSGSCVAASEKAFEDRVFTLTPSASQVAVTEGKDNVFQLCFSDPNQGVAAADYISEKMPDAKVGVIYNNASDYSAGIYDKFKGEMESKGKELAAVEAFSDDANTDFQAQINSMKNAGVDLVFLPIYYTPASNILIQADKIGYKPTFFGVDGMDGILTLEGFDTKLAEGVMLLTPFIATSEDEATQKFVTAYKEAYGEEPNQFAADAYDCVYAVYDAINKAGVDASASHEDLCEALVKTFTGDFTFSGVTGAEMKWNEAGEVNKTPNAMVIENGVYVPVK